MNKKIVTSTEAANLAIPAEEYAIIKNPDYVFPEYEICPVAAKITEPAEQLAAVLMDMDGTTTTTEELCIHSLEFMIRKLSGKMSTADWAGLDHVSDYPNIIGNSTTRHVEYLITKYRNILDEQAALPAFVYAALWTLVLGQDEQRKTEARGSLLHLQLGALLGGSVFAQLERAFQNSPLETEQMITGMLPEYSPVRRELSFQDWVRVGIDVYYQRYHEILKRIKNGESSIVSTEVFGDPDKNLIEPMAGVAVFLPLIKGWLGNEIAPLKDYLLAAYEKKAGYPFDSATAEDLEKKLCAMSELLVRQPAKVAIVTSSIFYEADIVVAEVFHQIRLQLNKLPLSDERKTFILERMTDHHNYYDGFVTASDSNEIRLKPHRDLYSIALHKTGVAKDRLHQVIGFEDSESGTIAIRAAGIGRCVAVPFAQTTGHNFEAATFTCKGGLPEVMLKYACFLQLNQNEQ